ncbi:MAG: cytochrome c biogenesis protein CcdA [Candidatus Latescibacteria bacterium]|nr:cytochrome c biogenesis protein CcdA [Candidatus Latescibacterota bacterium]
MESLFASLTAAVSGSPPIALGAAFLWGVLSILLSPCHLASIPLIVGFIQGQQSDDQRAPLTQRRALWLSTLFASGILVTIALIGAITAAAGRMLGDIGGLGNLLVAGIFLVVGLILLGVIPLNLSGPGAIGLRRKGAWAALLLGLVFGVALGPCTFAFMAPMLAVTFKVSSTQAVFGAALLAAYGVGHCLLIVIAGTSTAWVQRTLDWNAGSRAGGILKKVCGGLVILGGFYLIFTSH